MHQKLVRKSEIKELISFNPVIRDGEVGGIRVNPVKSSPFFQDDNLEPGDILTSFNGQKVTTVDLERELNQKVKYRGWCYQRRYPNHPYN